MRRVWDAALDLLYPPRCCGCGEPGMTAGFCLACRGRIVTPAAPLCPVCGVPFTTSGDAGHLCGRCLARRPRFRQARACALYDTGAAVAEPLRAVLQRYKYNRDLSLAPALTQVLRTRSPLALSDYDAVLPVPLHVDRLRWRGFNQSQCLVDPLARRAGVPVDMWSLERVRPTRPQVDLDEAERHRNVAGAFRVRHPHRVAGRRILLLDDVYTTGATVDECSRVLRRAGARCVDVLVLARAVLH